MMRLLKFKTCRTYLSADCGWLAKTEVSRQMWRAIRILLGAAFEPPSHKTWNGKIFFKRQQNIRLEQLFKVFSIQRHRHSTFLFTQVLGLTLRTTPLHHSHFRTLRMPTLLHSRALTLTALGKYEYAVSPLKNM